ncbi:MAG: MOSC domain-containing protein [Cytophagaceae bacterium]|nr:MOSC domain-containing protein [Gemmatimonadaceae bacterium]
MVTALIRYPIKSCRGTALTEAPVGARGIVGDREYMIVDADGGFLTQREVPRMALVVPLLASGALWLSGEGMPDLEVLQDANGAPVRVTVWSDTCMAIDQGAQAAAWLSGFLEHPCRLVYLPAGERRRADQEHAGPDDEVGFADGFPFLLTTEASLHALNQRLASPLPMNRFRPNIVIDGRDAFEEDGWSRIRIGDLGFRVVKPCARCAITTVDQLTAAAGKEPLRTLATFRRVSGKGVMFGQNLLHDGPGVLRVGSSVTLRP